MGQRRDTLLAKPEFDAACQEFHDYYLEHLKYDFSVALREKGIVVPLPPQSSSFGNRLSISTSSTPPTGCCLD